MLCGRLVATRGILVSNNTPRLLEKVDRSSNLDHHVTPLVDDVVAVGGQRLHLDTYTDSQCGFNYEIIILGGFHRSI